MTELMTHNFWWLRMGHYVADYMEGCNLCNCTKTFPASPTGKLMPNRVPNHCWKVISVDVMMEVPLSQDYNALMVAVDCLSK